MKSVKLVKKAGLFLLACVILSLASCTTKPKPKGDLEQGRQYSRDAEAGMNRAFNN